MAVDALVKPLLSLPLFRGLQPSQLAELVRHAERVIYQPGAVIAAQDAAADAAILIVSGPCARIRGDGRPSSTEMIPEGSMVAELAMLVEMDHGATVVARGRTKALRFPRTEMHALMEADSSLAEHFTSVMSARLKSLIADIDAFDRSLAIADEAVHLASNAGAAAASIQAA